MAKGGTHKPTYILSAPDGIELFEGVYGSTSLKHSSPMETVRIITAAPEIPNVLDVITPLPDKDITVGINHLVASIAIASGTIKSKARVITHLFNAMLILHHRGPSTIGLLRASSVLDTSALSSHPPEPVTPKITNKVADIKLASEAPAELPTPPRSPVLKSKKGKGFLLSDGSMEELGLEGFTRPFYELIVDGVHSHPNSVRVSDPIGILILRTYLYISQLAYMAHKEGCILITDGLSIP